MEYDVFTDPIRRAVFAFLYSFHMPLFIFLSGFFSKNMTHNKWLKTVYSLSLTYLVFQLFYTITTSFMGNTFDLVKFLTQPQSILWYIVGLILWRSLIYVVQLNSLKFVYVFPLSLLVSFALSRSLDSHIILKLMSFFPYFVLGYYCTQGVIQTIRNTNRAYAVVIMLLVFTLLYLYADNYLLFAMFGDSGFSYYPPSHNPFLLKTLVYLLSITMSACIINIATDKLHKWGDKTLPVYLLHPIFVYICYRDLFLNNFTPNAWFILVDFGAAILITFWCIFLARFTIIQYWTNPIQLVERSRLAKNAS
jgi:fucose 4-O-acetylase-like acetyltransferase